MSVICAITNRLNCECDINTSSI